MQHTLFFLWTAEFQTPSGRRRCGTRRCAYRVVLHPPLVARFQSWKVVLDCRPGLASWIVVLDCRPGLSPWIVVLDCRPGLSSWIAVLDCRPGLSSWIVVLDCRPGLSFWTGVLDCRPGSPYQVAGRNSCLEASLSPLEALALSLARLRTEEAWTLTSSTSESSS